MSRTYRRKNVIVERFSARGNTQGRKVNGYYTTWDKCEQTGNGHGGMKIFRPMTKAEINEENLRLFGESKNCNAWGPGSFYKDRLNRFLRRDGKREIHKELLNPEYEGVHDVRGKNPWDLYYW